MLQSENYRSKAYTIIRSLQDVVVEVASRIGVADWRGCGEAKTRQHAPGVCDVGREQRRT
jgi:hypothetical protein